MKIIQKTLIEIMNLKIPLICSHETPMKQITKNYSILCKQNEVKSIEKKLFIVSKITQKFLHMSVKKNL